MLLSLENSHPNTEKKFRIFSFHKRNLKKLTHYATVKSQYLSLFNNT